MHKKGQILMSVIFAVAFFMVGMMVINPIKDLVTDATSASQLNCDGAGISDGTKVTCLAMDGIVPYVIISVLSLTGGIVFARLLV